MTDHLTPTQAPLRCSPDELRTLFLFEKLSDDQLGWLCEQRLDQGIRTRSGLHRG